VVNLQRSVIQHDLIYFGIGLAEWLALVAIPAIHDSNWSTSPYFVVALISSLVLGAIDYKAPHIRAAALLVAPAIILALWTTPTRDNDGLWVLIVPLLVFFLLILCGGHWLGAFARRKLA
jgi:hypothetical protein